MGLTYNGPKYVYLCGTKYVYLYNPHSFKSLSLEDNVYFTLRDIFINAERADDAIECNQFNSQLTNEICFEDRTDTFTYTDILQDKDFVEGLVKWLNYTRPERDFFFTDEIDEDDEYKFNVYTLTTKWKYSESDNTNEYRALDAWMGDFNDLINNLSKRSNELNKQ